MLRWVFGLSSSSWYSENNAVFAKLDLFSSSGHNEGWEGVVHILVKKS
jgi:hypothetical protein